MYDLRDPKFFDEAEIDREIRRVFDVCHTCRMCFSYCPSFPSLFDAVDRHTERGEGEVEAMTQPEIDEVVDLCWQCKLCYVKCPYTPPHKFAIDFPRLLQRQKWARVRRKGVALRERVLGDPERLGKVAGAGLSSLVNYANRHPLFRLALEKLIGVHRKRQLPKYAARTFARWFRRHQRAAGSPVTPGLPKIALFETCSVNYNNPEIGIAAVQVLEHNGRAIVRPETICCGLPALDGGDLDAARRYVEHNVAILAPLVRAGAPVVILGPSCGLTIKKEWPELVPTDDCRAVAAAAMDIGEFLAKEKAAGRLALDFKAPQGSIAYHIPCHLRAQNVGQPFNTLFSMIPGTNVQAIEQCSAFDGTWGMKTEFYETSRKCAGKLCGAMTRSGAEKLVSDCTLAGINVKEELGRSTVHPIEVLRDAYGLKPDPE